MNMFIHMYTFMQISIAAMNLILQQQKRKHVKIPVDIAKEGILYTSIFKGIKISCQVSHSEMHIMCLL